MGLKVSDEFTVPLCRTHHRDGCLGVVAASKFRNTIPQELAKLGYSTIANYPVSTSFLNTKQFFNSIGFRTINSPDEMRLSTNPGEFHLDKEYYEFVSRRPDIRTNEIKVGDEVAEFARRQRIAADDLKWFEDQLRARFSKGQFIVAGFGDHHPLITSDYFHERANSRLQPRAEGETLQKTYFRVNGINVDLHYDRLPKEADIGFLGEMIMDVAGLPASQSILARRWLRNRCNGTWASCPDQNAVLDANTNLTVGESSLFTSGK